MAEKSNSGLPPGFRFHPTDEELIIYYLQNQAMSRPCPVSIIHEVDIYKFDPWQLPDKAESGENEWYFFSPRDRKYPNGIRPNRSTVSGYWKATGTDRAIYSETKFVGIKKALVFYQGRPPKGTKTNWIMHEYRLSESRVKPVKQRGSSMRLDDWVLCRIYKKRHAGRTSEQRELDEDSPIQTATVAPTNVNVGASGPEQQELKFPMTFSTSQLMELDYLGQIPNLFNGGNPFDSSTIEFQTSITGAGIDPNGGEKGKFGDLTTMTMDQIGVLGQQLVANHNQSSVSFF